MVTNNFVFAPSVALTYSFDTSLTYLFKSALNYKVNINKVHFKAGWKYFLCCDILHFKKQTTSNSRRKTACSRVNKGDFTPCSSQNRTCKLTGFEMAE